MAAPGPNVCWRVHPDAIAPLATPHMTHPFKQVISVWFSNWMCRAQRKDPDEDGPTALLLQYSDMLHPANWSSDYNQYRVSPYANGAHPVRHMAAVRILRAHCSSIFCAAQSHIVLCFKPAEYRDKIAYQWIDTAKWLKEVLVTSPFHVETPEWNILTQSIKLNHIPESEMCVLQRLPPSLAAALDGVIRQMHVVETLPAAHWFKCRYTEEEAVANPSIYNCTCYADSAHPRRHMFDEDLVELRGRELIFKNPTALAHHFNTGRHATHHNYATQAYQGEPMYDMYHTMNHSTWQKFRWLAASADKGRVYSVTDDDILLVSAAPETLFMSDPTAMSHKDTFAYRMQLRTSTRFDLVCTTGVRIDLYCDGQRMSTEGVQCEVALMYHYDEYVKEATKKEINSRQNFATITQSAKKMLPLTSVSAATSKCFKRELNFMCTSVPHELVANCDKAGDPVYSSRNYSDLYKRARAAWRQDSNSTQKVSIYAAKEQLQHDTFYPIDEFNRLYNNTQMLYERRAVLLLYVRVALPVNWQMQLFVTGYYLPDYKCNARSDMTPADDDTAPAVPLDHWFEGSRCHAFAKVATVTAVNPGAMKTPPPQEKKYAAKSDMAAKSEMAAAIGSELARNAYRDQEEAQRAELAQSIEDLELTENVEKMIRSGCLDDMVSDKHMQPADKQTLFHLRASYTVKKTSSAAQPQYYEQIKGSNYLRALTVFRKALRDGALTFLNVFQNAEVLSTHANPYIHAWSERTYKYIEKTYGVPKETLQILSSVFVHLQSGEEDKFMCGQLHTPLQDCAHTAHSRHERSFKMMNQEERRNKLALIKDPRKWRDVDEEAHVMRTLLNGLILSLRDTAKNLMDIVDCCICDPLQGSLDPASFKKASDFFRRGVTAKLHEIFVAIFPLAATHSTLDDTTKQMKLRGTFARFDMTKNLIRRPASECIFDKTVDIFEERVYAVQQMTAMNDMLNVTISIARTTKSTLIVSTKVGSDPENSSSIILVRNLQSVAHTGQRSRLETGEWYAVGAVDDVTGVDGRKRTSVYNAGLSQCLYAGAFPLPEADRVMLARQFSSSREAQQYVLNANSTAGETFAVLVVQTDMVVKWVGTQSCTVQLAMFECPDVYMRSLSAWNMTFAKTFHSYFQQCKKASDIVDTNPLYIADAREFTENTKIKASLLLAFIFDGGKNDIRVKLNQKRVDKGYSPKRDNWCFESLLKTNGQEMADLYPVLAYIIYKLNGDKFLDEKQCEFVAHCTIWSVKGAQGGNAHVLNGVPGGGKTTVATIVNVVLHILAAVRGKQYRSVYMTHANSATTDIFRKMVRSVEILLNLRNKVNATSADVWERVHWQCMYDVSHVDEMRYGNGPTANLNNRTEPHSWGPRPVRIFAGRFQSSDIDEDMVQFTNFGAPHSKAARLLGKKDAGRALMHELVSKYTDLYLTTACSLQVQSCIPSGMITHVVLDEAARLHIGELLKSMAYFLLSNSVRFPVTVIFMGDVKQPGPYAETFMNNCLHAIYAGESALVHLTKCDRVTQTHLNTSYRCSAPICACFAHLYLPVQLHSTREFQQFDSHGLDRATEYRRDIPNLYKCNYLKHPVEYIPLPAGYATHDGANRSWTNSLEVLVFARICFLADFILKTQGRSVGVIVHYTSQRLRLEAFLKEQQCTAYMDDTESLICATEPAEGVEYKGMARSPAGQRSGLQTPFQLGTHSHWQGLEADVMILLMTRDHRLGHAAQETIACVTLSRARYVNIVVGEVNALTKPTESNAPLGTWQRVVLQSPQAMTDLQYAVIRGFEGNKEKDELSAALRQFKTWQQKMLAAQQQHI